MNQQKTMAFDTPNGLSDRNQLTIMLRERVQVGTFRIDTMELYATRMQVTFSSPEDYDACQAIWPMKAPKAA